MELPRLTAAAALPEGIGPAYDPAAHGTGIVHIGFGAFHKAHQAAYTEAALARSGGDWRITGVSLRSVEPAAQITPQDGRYTLIERSAARTEAHVIAAVSRVLALPEAPGEVMAALTDPACRIVSLTVTEKAYGLDRAAQGCDPSHPAVKADLKAPEAPAGVLGLLVRALSLRFAAGVPLFTVLCCDNLPDNGALLRGAVIDFARRLDPALAERIGAEVAFPSTMVDRITPAATDETRAEAARLTGFRDEAAIETEGFRQWVIEDHFPLGRPDWEAAGAIFVDDVAPYEQMKLRMLNGTHSMLAYAGFHAGCRYVRDVMADDDLAPLVARHLAAAAGSLPQLPGIDLTAYAQDLRERFRNPGIAHETFQIAMDGTEKLPQRIFAPALEAARAHGNLRPYAFATAAWMRHVTGRTDDCAPYEIRDPRAAEIAGRLVGKTTAAAIVAALCDLPGFMPAGLQDHRLWRALLTDILGTMLAAGMRAALEMERQQATPGASQV
ncbi:mannitol dehydrogenase family protein [Frigidibacter sp. MR17.14]|uniref:mannitol dehydrogenase family protein n=1 Tax=Frigidibacter sp. MR17.14 TaxID=3126509 RepID=UPI0030130C9C